MLRDGFKSYSRLINCIFCKCSDFFQIWNFWPLYLLQKYFKTYAKHPEHFKTYYVYKSQNYGTQQIQILARVGADRSHGQWWQFWDIFLEINCWIMVGSKWPSKIFVKGSKSWNLNESLKSWIIWGDLGILANRSKSWIR